MAYKGGDRMIRVAICDDDKHMQESLSKYLLDYSMQCDREIDHAEFDTCEELMDEYLKGNSFDVILLDIEFKNNDEKQMNGIELGKRLRGLYANDNTAIVYVTSWFCQYHLTHFIRTRIMQRERYDHSRAFFELPEAAHRWRCRFFC